MHVTETRNLLVSQFYIRQILKQHRMSKKSDTFPQDRFKGGKFNTLRSDGRRVFCNLCEVIPPDMSGYGPSQNAWCAEVDYGHVKLAPLAYAFFVQFRQVQLFFTTLLV